MSEVFNYLSIYFLSCWAILVESAPYMLFGFFAAGLIHVFIRPDTIVTYLGKGRIRSVFYAALLGIPMPICSCGVLPTAVSLKKQGANDGAALSFLISTPETGADSIAVTYALMDPLMTVFRPFASFVTAITAGVVQNFFGKTYNETKEIELDRSCTIDNCCDGIGCPDEIHRGHHSFSEKLSGAIHYAFNELLSDIAGWFLLGITIAGAITIFIPESLIEGYLGEGLHAMLLMLIVSIPLYLCATASTPIAAVLVAQGMSPGAALVLLLAGPATNTATLSVVFGTYGKRAGVIYLVSIAICTIAMGLFLNQIYGWSGIEAKTAAGSTEELFPHWLNQLAAVLFLFLMLNTIYKKWRKRHRNDQNHEHGDNGSCNCK